MVPVMRGISPTLSRLLPLVLLTFLLIPAGCSREEEASAILAALEGGDTLSGLAAMRRADSLAPEYQSLVRDYWGTEAALQAAIGLMETTVRRTGRDARPGVVAAFTDSILAAYAESPGLERLARLSSLYSEEQRAHYFGRLRESSPHRAVRAAAIYYPAQAAMLSRRVSRLPLPASLMPAGSPEGEDPAELEAVKADLRTVLEEYGDLPQGNSTYGILADALLNTHSPEALAIGQPAPEIVGTNVDGEPMRLSDFRGKVVVLDFWGDW